MQNNISIKSPSVCVCGNTKEISDLGCPACLEAIQYVIDTGIIPNIGTLKNRGFNPAGKCSLCSGNYVLGGNNPQPVIEDFNARCCHKCNYTVVLSARIKEFQQTKNEK